ncbi:MAG: hypothetical protein OEM02_12835 [Desulfobulbaceae bacterium]|nr:hypothetical protein [Desulfobulbaceae bacterium]
MRKYSFKVDYEGRDYCDMVVDAIKTLTNCSEEEALSLVNNYWNDEEFVGDTLNYHEVPKHWAKIICYGDFYWKNE